MKYIKDEDCTRIGTIKNTKTCVANYMKDYYGSSFYKITEKEIEELRNGNIIAMNDGEYTYFIKLKDRKD